MLEKPLDNLSMKRREELPFVSSDITALFPPSMDPISTFEFTVQFTVRFTTVGYFVKKVISFTIIDLLEQGWIMVVV